MNSNQEWCWLKLPICKFYKICYQNLLLKLSNSPLASMSWNIGLPPNVADTKKWVPYFLIRFSWICWRLGLLPRSLRLRKNSGAKGSEALKKSLFSVTKLFTFQWLNSLRDKTNSVSALIHIADFGTHYVSPVIGRTEIRSSLICVCKVREQNKMLISAENKAKHA